MTSDNKLVKLEINAPLATITICREASLNALNEEVLLGLSAAIRELQVLCEGPKAYQTARVLVIRGSGKKAFVAGADIKSMQAAAQDELSSFVWLGQSVMRAIERLPLPVIAVVNGFAIGGGLELALACDLIVASKSAKLGQAEVNLGLIPGFGGTQRLLQRIGIGRTKQLIFSGSNISGEEAYRIGLVEILVSEDQLESTLSALVADLSSSGPLAIAAAKRVIGNASQAQHLAGLTREVEEFIEVFKTQDAAEGMTAFSEKRKAVFSGK